MAYDENLALRVRKILAGRRDMAEKTMFGGVAFLLNGNMFCGIVKDDLMLRVGPDAYADALQKPHVRPMDFTGRPLTGYVYVAAAGYRSDAALAKWLERGATFASTLPVKARKQPAAASRVSAKTARGRSKITRRH
jgi:TfoX/Sxy family transcriptional regulator of competence genes